MPTVELTDQEWQQVINILATTKEHAWVVTNPLLVKLTQQLQHQQTNSKEVPVNQGEIALGKSH